MKKMTGTAKSPEVSGESVPNRNLFIANTNFLISEGRTQQFYRPIRRSSQRYLREVGEDCAELVKRLTRVDGIVAVTVQPYELMIEKAPLFDWDAIQINIARQLIGLYNRQYGVTYTRDMFKFSGTFTPRVVGILSHKPRQRKS
jgi:hypothetical protein